MSAIKLGPNTKVTLYENGNYSGRSVVIDKDYDSFCGVNINGISINDFPSSMRVICQDKYDPNRPRPGCAWIWEDCNYGGRKQEVCGDSADLGECKFNKIMSAIMLGPETKVTLYEGTNYSGRHVELTKDYPSFCGVVIDGISINDFPSSMCLEENCGNKPSPTPKPTPILPPTTPPAGCAWLYENANYGGGKIQICGDTNLGDIKFNKLTSSIKLGPGANFTLYDGDNFSGRSFFVNHDYPNFTGVSVDGVPLDNFAVSIKKGDFPNVQDLTIRGFIKDGTTGNLIPNVDISNFKVDFATSSKSYPATIFEGGIYEVKLPPGTYRRIGSLKGYSESSKDVTLTESSKETNSANTILLVPKIQGWTAVLTWNNIVKDLDIFSMSSGNERVYYQKKLSDDGKVSLDVDSRLGWGPETLSFKAISEGKFTIYVNNYSNERPLQYALPRVVLFHDGLQVAEQRPSPSDNADLRYWKVYVIDANAGTFDVVNKLQDGISQ